MVCDCLASLCRAARLVRVTGRWLVCFHSVLAAHGGRFFLHEMRGTSLAAVLNWKA